MLPIFRHYCFACHGDEAAVEKPANNFRLSTYADLMRGGEYGVDVIPANPESSRLIFFVTGKKMPANGTIVEQKDIDALIQWVAEGARNN